MTSSGHTDNRLLQYPLRHLKPLDEDFHCIGVLRTPGHLLRRYRNRISKYDREQADNKRRQILLDVDLTQDVDEALQILAHHRRCPLHHDEAVFYARQWQKALPMNRVTSQRRKARSERDMQFTNADETTAHTSEPPACRPISTVATSATVGYAWCRSRRVMPRYGARIAVASPYIALVCLRGRDTGHSDAVIPLCYSFRSAGRFGTSAVAHATGKRRSGSTRMSKNLFGGSQELLCSGKTWSRRMIWNRKAG